MPSIALQKLQTILPPTRSGRTFFVASSLLGLGALAQLGLMGVFLLRGGISRHPVAAPAIHFSESFPTGVRPEMAFALPSMPAPTPALPGATSSTDVQASALTGGSLASPTPAPELTGSEGGVMGLVEQARELRQRGDMPSALARLREAQTAAPDNPQIIAEMAITYERMKLDDRAFEQWQRLYNLGDATGALYYLAESRLNTAPAAPPANALPTPANPPAGFVNPQPTDQEPTVLKITDIRLEEVEDPSVEDKRVLRIVVKDRPGSAIDPMKVRILTYFYDQTDDKAIVLTNAQTAYAWVTQEPINWAGDKSEVLETTYLRSRTPPPGPAPADAPPPADARASSRRGGARGKKPEPTAAPTPAPSPTPVQHRTYYGYVVRLYYDRQLQDVHADPVRLLQQYPPQLTLPAE